MSIDISDIDYHQPLDQLELWLRGRTNDELRAAITSQWRAESTLVFDDPRAFADEWVAMQVNGVTALRDWPREDLIQHLLGLHEAGY